MDFNAIKVLGFDVDGTITTGDYTVSSNGVVSKSFYTRDIYALNKALVAGLDILIVTGSSGTCTKYKISNIKRTYGRRILLLSNVSDKVLQIEQYMKKRSLEWDNVAYMGDAENDLEAMKLAGITACPCDSIDDVKNESHWISDYPGGRGAVYDFVVNYFLPKKIME